MKIEYAQNPLFTKVILDEHEQEIFKLKIRLKEMEEGMYETYWTLTHHDWWNKNIAKDGEAKTVRTLQDTINEALRGINPDYWMSEDNEKSKLDERVDELFELFMADLSGGHAGDCICVPCSCSKCMAEGFLGIDTISGLGKHEAHTIDSLFEFKNEKSIDEVLEKLKVWEPSAFVDNGNPHWTKEHHDFHLPRWKREGANAYEWLKAYKEKHF